MMQPLFTKQSKLTLTLLIAMGLGACSSTIELKEPPMTPIESELKMVKKWQVFQGSLDKHDTEGLVFTIKDEQLFVANNNGRLSALKVADTSRWQDQVVWQGTFSEKVISGPVMDDDQLIVGTAKGRVKALDPATGSVKWQSQLSSEVLSAATVSQGKIYTRTADGKIYALNRANGEVVWVSEHQMPKLSLRGAPKVLASDDKVYVAWETGILQALEAQSGNLAWETRVAIPSGRTDLERIVDIQSNLALLDGTLYALGFHGKFVAINVETGNFRYVKELSGYRDFVVADQAIYLVDENDVIQALDRFTGTTLWKQKSMAGRMINDLNVYGGDLVAADAWGYVHWFNAVQGNEYARVKHSNEYGDGNRITNMKVSDNQLYLMDETGTISKYQVEKSNLLQFREQIAEQTGEPIEPLNSSESEPEETTDHEKIEKSESGFFSKLWPF
ncbi:outer membrane protein assembly factor BamB [Thiomicrorhabdus indica]|uniref:outer membrane protein assembly factor BamB n=1 Tax=Thiomicrorhabdus indica TaxID=2267253 RepID=UPI001F10A595|nr:outer membrane protein assembly factor BamB [Thiomicrorhabdus indica]